MEVKQRILHIRDYARRNMNEINQRADEHHNEEDFENESAHACFQQHDWDEEKEFEDVDYEATHHRLYIFERQNGHVCKSYSQARPRACFIPHQVHFHP